MSLIFENSLKFFQRNQKKYNKITEFKYSANFAGGAVEFEFIGNSLIIKTKNGIFTLRNYGRFRLRWLNVSIIEPI